MVDVRVRHSAALQEQWIQDAFDEAVFGNILGFSILCLKSKTTAVKPFLWNKEKNDKLQAERQVSFEQVVIHIAAGDLLDIVEHSNSTKYQKQRIFIVRINDYAWLVPFVESETAIFLKTIILSRKATRKYLRK